MILIVAYIALQLGMSSRTAAKSKKTVTIVIDPGHGGDDPGKVGINKSLEKDINLSISLQLKKMLVKSKIKVIMTRENDDGLYNDSDYNKKISDMRKRMDISNNNSADMFVSIHQNSYTSENVKGPQTFYYSKSDKGKLLAESIQKSILNSIEPQNSRAAKANDDYYILLHSECPAVIVECGFLSNYQEATLLKDALYQKKMAKAIKKGILQYITNCDNL